MQVKRGGGHKDSEEVLRRGLGRDYREASNAIFLHACCSHQSHISDWTELGGLCSYKGVTRQDLSDALVEEMSGEYGILQQKTPAGPE